MKVWRYMDLAKFISLLSKKSLYFSTANNFNDPYEFLLPDSHCKALDASRESWKEKDMRELKGVVPNIESTPQYAKILENYNNMPTTQQLCKEGKQKFGVSCWHINDYENEALWKIYTSSGQGIAIESTTEKLQNSLTYHRNIQFDEVRYLDFQEATIDAGYKQYVGVLKRKAFEYEKEFRASVLLDESDWGKGCFIGADLNSLIEKIHISPLMPEYFVDAVEFLLKDELAYLKAKLNYSNLYQKI
jgi:hypothetical protein